MKKYFNLLRVNHYIKNILIFFPVIFSKNISNSDLLKSSLLAFISFSMLSSVVYIINDINDLKKDRLHPVKAKRPLASGEIKVSTAVVIAVILFVLAMLTNYAASKNIYSFIYLMSYFILNITYSCGLKNYPILDIVILVSGYFLRLMYGGEVTGIAISDWLYLTVIVLAFYFAFGKRRNELIKYENKETRSVLKLYTKEFLDKNMYMCLTLANVFYALWATESATVETIKNGALMKLTVPLVMIICMKYNLNLDKNSEGNPVDVLLHDKVLILLCIIYAVSVMAILYL